MDLNVITAADAARASAALTTPVPERDAEPPAEAELEERELAALGGPGGPAAPAAPPAPAAPAAPIVPPVSSDDLYSRLLKYLPAPLIGIYLMVQNLIVSAASPSKLLAWLALAFFLVLTVIFLVNRSVRRPLQIAFSVLAFAAWASASPGPFQLMDGWETYYGTLALAAIAAILIAIKLPPIDETTANG